MSLNFKRFILSISFLVFLIKPSLAEVTFQEILENPADLEINLKYATEQEGLGRVSTILRLPPLYEECGGRIQKETHGGRRDSQEVVGQFARKGGADWSQ